MGREAQSKLEDEQRTKEVVRDNLLSGERRANSAQNAVEEARTLLEQSDRSRRMTEQELSDTNEQLSDMTCTNQAIAGAKRKLETEMQTLHGDHDEMAGEAHLSEEKAKKAMLDAAKLADELRCEQEMAQCYEKDMNKMDTRIRELESEVDAEARRMADSQKNLRKSERRIKELTYASDEDRKNHERMQALIDGLQSKIKSYKKQIEEAEEIAALNLAKYRTAQGHLGDAADRSDLNEHALAKARAQGRAASNAPM